MTESDDVMQALIRDIQLARHNIEMVFYIWQPGGMADQVAESLMAAARRGIHCRLMLDSAGSVAFFRSPWPELMRNAGIEVSKLKGQSDACVFTPYGPAPTSQDDHDR